VVPPVRRNVILDALVEAGIHFVHVGVVVVLLPAESSPPIHRQELLGHRILASASRVDAVVHY